MISAAITKKELINLLSGKYFKSNRIERYSPWSNSGRETGATFAGIALERFRQRSSRLKRSTLKFLRNSGRETGSHFRWNCSGAVSDLIESGRPLYLLVFIAFSSINRQPLDRKML